MRKRIIPQHPVKKEVRISLSCRGKSKFQNERNNYSGYSKEIHKGAIRKTVPFKKACYEQKKEEKREESFR